MVEFYGTIAFNGEIPYQIVSHSEYACAALCTDEYNVFCLKLTGLENGSSTITIKNQDGLILIVNFDVVSADTYDKLNHTMYTPDALEAIIVGYRIWGMRLCRYRS
ncbi:MAG TPA: hypothetical protein VN258_00605 [Mobilitalea sp.]|nr:hypothetical protein [Mobilitalea sp.]